MADARSGDRPRDRDRDRRRPTPAAPTDDARPGTRSSPSPSAGSYLQPAGWARVKAVNGWSAGSAASPTRRGRPGRRPRSSCAGRARALGVRLRAARTGRRGLGRRASLGRLRRALRGRRAGRAGAGRRSSHVRIDPEIEAGGPLTIRTARCAGRSERAGWRPAPPIQPSVDPDHRPARPTRTPCGATSARSGAST